MGRGSRGDVTILPTLVVNNRQYRGAAGLVTCKCFLYSVYVSILTFHLCKLGKNAVLTAVCSGFEETTEPDVCLRAGL
jgi:hypothetical protein